MEKPSRKQILINSIEELKETIAQLETILEIAKEDLSAAKAELGMLEMGFIPKSDLP